MLFLASLKYRINANKLLCELRISSHLSRYTQRKLVWDNLCEFILVAMNEMLRSRKDSVNLFNEVNRLRVG